MSLPYSLPRKYGLLPLLYVLDHVDSFLSVGLFKHTALYPRETSKSIESFISFANARANAASPEAGQYQSPGFVPEPVGA